MCGRFTITVSSDELNDYVLKRYKIYNQGLFEIPNYNIAPGTSIIAIIHDGLKHRIGTLKWGYLPPFPIKSTVGFINAKAETIFEKPSFKKAILRQRCSIIADGFYEWKQEQVKKPMRIITDGSLFGFAGIWNTVIDDKGNKSHTVAILTTDANKKMSEVHHRMPVILNKETEEIWLNTNSDMDKIKSILKPYENHIDIYPVSPRVNSSLVYDINLIDRII